MSQNEKEKTILYKKEILNLKEEINKKILENYEKEQEKKYSQPTNI
jgi:hypothetical protein